MESLIEKMESSLKQRRKADAVRFVYDAEMPQHLLDFLVSKFSLGKYDSLIPGGATTTRRTSWPFPASGPKYLELKPLPVIRLPEVEAAENILAAIRAGDILLYYPYHPFDYVIDLLKTAAMDPQVESIRICLYRVASGVAGRRCAAQRGAQRQAVLAVVELAARFDEQANIAWAQRLTDGGIEVMFGIPGLKVHSKLLLMQRREEGRSATTRTSAPGTSTRRPRACTRTSPCSPTTRTSGARCATCLNSCATPTGAWSTSTCSCRRTRAGPACWRRSTARSRNARKGLRAAMTLKCNNLVDRELVHEALRGQRPGVEIRLIVRGMCSLQPGVKGISENIEAISIVDRYLEHPRAYVFYNAGDPEYYIGSADLMTRNLDYRVEVLCPVREPRCKANSCRRCSTSSGTTTSRPGSWTQAAQRHGAAQGKTSRRCVPRRRFTPTSPRASCRGCRART
jgi:polyphosphate kinase